jgi:hypothetical protein
MVGIRPLSLALLMFALLAPASASAAPPTRIIVQRETGLSRAEQKDIRQDAHVTLVRPLQLPQTDLVKSSHPEEALATLRSDDDVVFAQIDHVRHIAAFDRFPRQWGLANTGQSAAGFIAGVSDADIDAPEAWAQQDASAAHVTGVGQEIGVVDTGADDSLSDLAGQVVEKRDFIGGAPGNAGATDGNGHGTHVAGIIAAADNDDGIEGAAPGAGLMVLKALDDDGEGRDSDIADAMVYAGEQGIRVVNLSLGGTDPAPLLDAAIAASPDTLFVVAAGNDGNDDDVDDYWPCNSAEPNVLCVGASTNRDRPADFSNFGATTVDLFAPGDGILSLVPESVLESVYVYQSGTSMAAPYVSAVAALVMQANPLLTVADAAQLIRDTVDHPPAFAGKAVTGGRLNAAVAVASAISYPAAPADTDADGVYDVVDACDGPGDGTDGCSVRDADGDGKVDAADNCPSVANSDQDDDDGDGIGNVCDSTPRGADNDADGIGALDDNCPSRANAGQADADRDGLGDACDSTPRGPDADHDGKPALDDACPNVYGTMPNGCPKKVVTPTKPPAAPADRDHDGRLDRVDSCPTESAATPNGCPLPYLTALSAKARKRHGKRYATITVGTSRAASLQITVQRKRGHRWVKVTRRVRASSANHVSLKVKRLRKGRYRVVVVASSPAGRAAAVTRRFRVR